MNTSNDIHSYEFTVKVCLLAYPSINPTRNHAVEHLFCVLGNGYDWEGGALVEKCGDETMATVRRMLQEGRLEKDIRAWIDKENKDRNRDALKAFVDGLSPEIRNKFREKTPPSFDYPLTIYPICELCPILQLPEDIKPDWLSGAKEAVQLIQIYPSHGNAETIMNRRKWVPIIDKLIEKHQKNIYRIV